jgi:hypothetical protein
MATVFWMSRLKGGVAAIDYETWVRDFDYAKAGELPSLRSYQAFRIQAPFLDDESKPFDYLEVRRELSEHPAARAIAQEWGDYVELVYSLSGTLIPPGVIR